MGTSCYFCHKWHPEESPPVERGLGAKAAANLHSCIQKRRGQRTACKGIFL